VIDCYVNNAKRPISKVSSRWACLKQRKELREMRQLEANAIQEAIEQAMINSGASRTFVKSANGMELTGTLDKQLLAANGGSLSATHTALLPTRALSKGARESYVVPGVGC
jgi:soluble cytochrome b562